MLNNPWLAVLDRLELTKAEEHNLTRYLKDPGGRHFLALADILKAHGREDECIELLIQGVAMHPDYTVARVILSRELYLRGLFIDAWQTLEASVDPLYENVLAQRLKLKLSLVLKDEPNFRQTMEHIHRLRLKDDDCELIDSWLRLHNFSVVQEEWVKVLKSRGVPLNADSVPNDKLAQRLKDPDRGVAPPSYKTRLGQFQVISLAEVMLTAYGPSRAASPLELELDSLSLVQHYRSKGDLEQAILVLRRLLKCAPQSEMLRQRLVELEDEQRRKLDGRDSIDAETIDRWHNLKVIDRKIHFLENLLQRL